MKSQKESQAYRRHGNLAHEWKERKIPKEQGESIIPREKLAQSRKGRVQRKRFVKKDIR